MRIGLIADLHGNLFALDTVLANLDRAGVDQILCLGDLAVLGPQPAEVIARIRERGIATVCGNTDAWLVPDHSIPVIPPDSRESIDLTAWTIAQLNADQIGYLQGLPLTMTVSVGEDAELLCFHATPNALDDITHARSPIAIGEGLRFEAACCGHTHVQAMWRVDQQRWVNPGSVGLPGVGPSAPALPQNRDVAWAEYAVLAIDDQHTAIALHRIELDIAEMWKSVLATDMPHQAWWRRLWRN